MINASEIMIVYRDPVTQCLVERSVIFPPEMSDELRNTLDVELTLAMAMGIDADMANGSLGSLSSYCLPRVLVHDVREFTVYCDVAAPLTRMVRFSIDVGADTNVLTLNGAATLRAARIGDLGEKDGDYFLTPPDGG